MKTSRKGFTLVELLIVVAILATLTATMTYSVSGSTAKAKAATIASNVQTCISAAQLYAKQNADTGGVDFTQMTADEVLYVALPSWMDYKNKDDGIRYKSTDAKDVANWAITVDFGNDPKKVAIRDALITMKGYRKSYAQNVTADATAGTTTYTYTGSDVLPTNKYWFQVNLTTGAITALDTQPTYTDD